MDKTYKIEPRQREALAEMLRDAKNRKDSELEESSGISRAAVVKELASEEGADGIVKQIAELHPKIQDLQSQLRRAERELIDLGFEWEPSSVSLHYSADATLRKKFEAMLRKKREPIEKSLRKYDLAIAEIWTVDSNADASKIVEGLL